MGKFWVATPDRKLLATGHCPDGFEDRQGGLGNISGAGDPPPDVEVPNEPVVQESVDAKRARAYPPITDQLDMLWHAMNIGQIPKAQQFFNARKKVKDSFPKPNQ